MNTVSDTDPAESVPVTDPAEGEVRPRSGSAAAGRAGAPAGTIRMRLAVMAGALFLAMLLVGGASLYGLYSVNRLSDRISGDHVARLKLAGRIQQDILDIGRIERSAMLAADATAVDRLQSATERLERRLEQLRDTAAPDDRAELERLEAALQEWGEIRSRVRELDRQGRADDAFALLATDGRLAADEAAAQARQIADDALAGIDRDVADGEGRAARASWIVLAALCLSTLAGGLIWLTTTRHVARIARQREKARKALIAQNRAFEVKLQRAEEEINQLVYVASHDLKAPLRGVDSLASWIAEDLGDDLQADVKANIELLRGRVRRLEALLNDILTFSRIGRITDDVKTVEMGPFLEDLVDLLTLPPGFTVRWPSDLPVLRAPPASLEQVFGNLIGNVVKHHDRSRGVIDISCADAGDYYEFSIADDGPGIAPEFHGRIFQMFQSLRPRDEVEGSGMGLAIVKKTIESQGGRISVESEAGRRGTIFRFTWPKNWHSKEQAE